LRPRAQNKSDVIEAGTNQVPVFPWEGKMALLKWLDDNMERLLAASLLAAIVILTTANVILRYAFNASLSWGEELTLWIFVWFVWIAVSLAFQRGEHIRITVMFDLLGPRAQRLLEITVGLLILLFFFTLSVECAKLMLKPFVASQKSVVLGLPIPILYASAPVGAMLSSFRVDQHLIRTLRSPLHAPSKGH
jgi:TRAP-type C4-dicarboxylate transport system permease small subunit